MHIISINQKEGWKMIIAGHYRRTGAHIFSSISSSGQSLMGLTGEECVQCVCSLGIKERQKGSSLAQLTGLFQSFIFNPLLCSDINCCVTLGLTGTESKLEREREKKKSLLS